MKIWIKVIFLFLIWTLTWGIFTALRPLGVDMVNMNFIAVGYFSFVTLAFVFGYKEEYEFFARQSWKDYLFFFTVLALGPISYFIINKYLIPQGFSVGDLEFAIRADYRYLLSIAVNIVFQQAFFYFAVKDIFGEVGWSIKNSLKFGSFLALIHLPLLYIEPTIVSVCFIVASFFFGIIFYYFTSHYKGAFLKNASIHYLFYVIFPLIYWLCF